jgi:ABC-type lipoprotein export system ATPase subunit
MPKKIIEIQNLSKSFGNKVIFKNVNFSINENEFIIIIGESGSGKSTLLGIFGLLDTKYQGTLLYNGEDVKKIKDLSRVRFIDFGFVFQMYYLIEEYTVLQNVIEPFRYHKEPIAQDVDGVLVKLNIINLKNTLVKKLSGGEKQRVAFARAIINNPRIIFADEPTGNLDPENSKIIVNYLLNEFKSGRTIVMVTHDLTLLNYATKVYRIKQDGIYEEN